MSLSSHLLKSPYESLVLYKYYLLPSGWSPSCFLALLCSPLPWVFKKYIYIIWKAFSSPVLPIFCKTSFRVSTHIDLFSPLNPFKFVLPNQNLNIYCLVLQMFLPCTFTHKWQWILVLFMTYFIVRPYFPNYIMSLHRENSLSLIILCSFVPKVGLVSWEVVNNFLGWLQFYVFPE